MIQIGNGNWAVKEDNLLGFRYDETEGVYFPREMTFGRACDATRVNPDGLIERVPYNLLQQSNSFDTTWVNGNTSEVGGQIGYDGSSNAWLLSKTANSYSYIQQSITISGLFTFSVYAKAGTLDILNLRESNGSRAQFDLTNGTSSLGDVSTSIEPIGNGWYRCSAVFNKSITTVRMYIDWGETTAGNIYIQDAQLVEGTTAKPYFPTTNRQDMARIDYSSGTGALLLEPQRTNLVTYSEQFDNAAWSKLNAAGGSAPVVTENYGLAPDNTMSADRVQLARTTQTFSYSELKQNFGTTGTQYTVSVYLKSLSGTPTISFARDGSSFNYLATLTNDWVRYTATFTASGTPSAELILYQQVSATSLSADFLVWGFQAEASSYPTSYIPTTSSTVTRLADTCYTDVNTLIPSGNTFTWFVEFIVPEFVGGGGDFFAKDTGGANDLRIYANNNGIVRFRVDPLGQNYDVSASVGDLVKCVMKCDSGVVSVFYNGEKKYTFSATTIDFHRMQFGQPSASPKINASTLYPSAMSDADCINLTTI